MNREKKVNANYMREKGFGDILALRKSIGRKGENNRAKSKAIEKAKGGEHRTKKERYESMLRIGKEGADHFQKSN